MELFTIRRLFELIVASLTGWSLSFMFHLRNYQSELILKHESEAVQTLNFSNITSLNEDETFTRLIEEQQEIRLKRLQIECNRRFNQTCTRQIAAANPTSLYSSNFNYTICRIQKVASSNWLRSILVMEEIYSLDDLHQKKIVGDPVIVEGNAKRSLRSLKSAEKQNEMWNKSLNIIMVRHPFLRVASAFHDKMALTTKSPVYRSLARKIEMQFRKYRQNVTERVVPLKGIPTFEDFVNFLTNDKSPRASDAHWKDYNSKCHPCMYNYDFIAKLETVEDDMRYLRKKLSVPQAYNEVFLKSGKFVKHNETKLFRELPKTLIYKLYNRYSFDFFLFGYNFPSWISC